MYHELRKLLGHDRIRIDSLCRLHKTHPGAVDEIAYSYGSVGLSRTQSTGLCLHRHHLGQAGKMWTMIGHRENQLTDPIKGYCGFHFKVCSITSVGKEAAS